MATLRDTPYGQFNFLVDLGTGTTAGVQAGFSEVSGISAEITYSEYRAGNDRESSPRKIPGLARYDDVTLRRGVIGSLDLYQWLADVRNGSAAAARTVTISLQNEDRSATVLQWKLLRARPVRFATGPLVAVGARGVAIEELTLSFERLELA